MHADDVVARRSYDASRECFAEPMVLKEGRDPSIPRAHSSSLRSG
jgi:hypothetical protein